MRKWIDAKTFNREEKVAAVTALYSKLGIDTLAKEKIEYYFQRGQEYLDKVALPAERKSELIAYTNEMMKRNK